MRELTDRPKSTDFNAKYTVDNKMKKMKRTREIKLSIKMCAFVYYLCFS